MLHLENIYYKPTFGYSVGNNLSIQQQYSNTHVSYIAYIRYIYTFAHIYGYIKSGFGGRATNHVIW